ncbi:MAG: calmodulin-binding protein [Thermoguttaceae bacterium]|jgi:hypothetical protein
MKIRYLITVFLLAFAATLWCEKASAQQPLGVRASANYNAQNWGRFFHYPYVYYPQNFRPIDNYRSTDDLYYRYRPDMQVPTYNPYWQNYYPNPRRYHRGAHFVLDIM